MAALHAAGYDQAAVIGHVGKAGNGVGSCSISVISLDSNKHQSQEASS